MTREVEISLWLASLSGAAKFRRAKRHFFAQALEAHLEEAVSRVVERVRGEVR